jgi:hypothetical protein
VLSPSRDECAIFGEFYDAIICLVALKHTMAVGNKDVAVRCGDHIGGHIEHTRCAPGLTRLPQLSAKCQ